MVGILLLVTLIISFSLAAPQIEIKNPWIMEPPPGPGTTMMGMVIVNRGDEEDYLVGASTDVARIVEIHKTVLENGIAKMKKQEKVKIPPRSKVEFRHHGYHLMLIDLQKKLRRGDKVKVKLHFSKSGIIELEVPVKAFHHMEEHDHEHEHKHDHEHMKHMKEERFETL